MNNRTILIADDDDLIIKSFERAFIEKNFNVFTADNGISALDKFNSFSPKIILMDIDMPAKNGWEVLKEIRKVNRFIPIVIMSNKYIDEDSALKSYEDGATSFIRKSTSMKELIAYVDALYNTTYSPNESIGFGKYTLNTSTLSIYANKEKYHLTEREVRLLFILVKNLNNIVERKDILNFVWGNDSTSNSQMLRNTITKLNKFFFFFGEMKIKSVFGKGYIMQKLLN
jgi:DNA-binding response OmpR family regulator